MHKRAHVIILKELRTMDAVLRDLEFPKAESREHQQLQ
jgi:hypothetical protein